jgi:hypothetical protein|tara:strand:+ start:79 stop:261 length:183 start_codon:yes stop_codon:yes gene_type:complete
MALNKKTSLKTSLKFNKVLERIHELKLESLKNKYPDALYSKVNDIDARVKGIFEIYKNYK